MHLVMFDIDGTLVDSAGFDSELYVEAVRSVLNVEIDSDWNAYEHVSDSGILEEVLGRAWPDSELYVEAVRSVLTSRASGWSMSRLRLE